MHYDLRLEMDGVLKSWAVPKGPSLDPTQKRLAVHVEDHPIEYGNFEGIIPEGEYGGGTVMLWDTGIWIPQVENAHKAYQDGNLTFELKGKKLRGLWKLIRIKTTPKNWLLIKIKDNYARAENEYSITQDKTKSVKSRRTMAGIATHAPKVWQSNQHKKKLTQNIGLQTLDGAHKATQPSVIDPELATYVDNPPDGDRWLHEIKFDGYRLIAFITNKKVKLVTRHHQDWTDKFITIADSLQKLKLPNAIFDGEIVALDQNQHSDFQLLQNSLQEDNPASLVYYIFDLLYYDGYDLTQVKLIERKNLLSHLIGDLNQFSIRYSDHIIGNGKEFFDKACEMELEGILSKEIDSLYLQKRTRSWQKAKCLKRQEFIVVGYTPPGGQRAYFGSLLLAVCQNEELIYCGHVGTGFTEKTLEEMAHLLEKYKTTQSPLKNLPPDVRKVQWVKPKIIVEVQFSTWTKDNYLRHPSFKGIRYDKPVFEVQKEIPVKKSTQSKQTLTHPEKFLYPESKITKLDIANYYENIKDLILPYIINRPLTLVRCPHGIDAKCFFQKRLHEDNAFIYPITTMGKKEKEEYCYIKDYKGLQALVQLGVLEIHVWNSRIDNIEKPDMLVFDLDPAPDVKWPQVIKAAKFIKKELENIQLTSFVRTTGGKGLHIVIPIRRYYDWSIIKIFTRTFVEYIISLKPNDFIATMSKAKRPGKIFVDYLRNERGATSIASYSTRAREGAPVATLLTWDELTSKIKPNEFTIKNLPKRLAKLKNDPWEGFFDLRQSLKIDLKE